MANTFLFANNAATTLASNLSAATTSIQLAAGTGALFPSPGLGQQFAITLIDAATGLVHEICYCTARTGDTLTVVRGQEGTTATTWLIGDAAQNLWTAGQAGYLFQNLTSGFITNGSTTYSSTVTMGTAQIGQYIIFNGVSASTLTLPPANSLSLGAFVAKLAIANEGTANLTLAPSTGNTLAFSPVVLAPGQQTIIVSDGSAVWHPVFNGAAYAQVSGSSGQQFNVAPATASSQAPTLGQLFGTWANKTSSRAINTVYTNSGPGPMFVAITALTSTAYQNLVLYVNGVIVAIFGQPNGGGSEFCVSGMVPSGATYELSDTGGSIIIQTWVEAN